MLGNFDKRDFLVFSNKDPLEVARSLGMSDFRHNFPAGETLFETEEERNAYYEGIALAEEEEMTGGPHGGADLNHIDYPESYIDHRYNNSPRARMSSKLEDNILSYSHNTWTGYVRSANDRKDDDFASHLRSICRG